MTVLRFVLTVISGLCLAAWFLFLAAIAGMAIQIVLEVGRSAVRLLRAAIGHISRCAWRRANSQLYRELGIRRYRN